MSDEKTEKTHRRWVVEAELETNGAGWRKFHSRPLMESTADELASSLRGIARNVVRVPRRFTRDDLDEAERLAEMGRETSHLGQPD